MILTPRGLCAVIMGYDIVGDVIVEIESRSGKKRRETWRATYLLELLELEKEERNLRCRES